MPDTRQGRCPQCGVWLAPTDRRTTTCARGHRLVRALDDRAWRLDPRAELHRIPPRPSIGPPSPRADRLEREPAPAPHRRRAARVTRRHDKVSLRPACVRTTGARRRPRRHRVKHRRCSRPGPRGDGRSTRSRAFTHERARRPVDVRQSLGCNRPDFAPQNGDLWRCVSAFDRESRVRHEEHENPRARGPRDHRACASHGCPAWRRPRAPASKRTARPTRLIARSAIGPMRTERLRNAAQGNPCNGRYSVAQVPLGFSKIRAASPCKARSVRPVIRAGRATYPSRADGPRLRGRAPGAVGEPFDCVRRRSVAPRLIRGDGLVVVLAVRGRRERAGAPRGRRGTASVRREC